MNMRKWIVVSAIACALWMGNSGVAAAYPVVIVRPGPVHCGPVRPVVVRPVSPVVVRPAFYPVVVRPAFYPVVVRPAVIVPPIVLRPGFWWWWW